MAYDDFLQLLKKRRSSWVFKPDPIADELIEKKMRALSEVMHRGVCQESEFRTDGQIKAYFSK